MMSWFAIATGGAIGTIIRYGLLRICPNTWGTAPTLIANIFSCMILGYCLHKTTLLQHPDTRLLLTTGLCGGMSTFSTLIYELYQYYLNGNFYNGLAYIFMSIILGAGCLIAGVKLAAN